MESLTELNDDFSLSPTFLPLFNRKRSPVYSCCSFHVALYCHLSHSYRWIRTYSLQFSLAFTW